MDYKALCVECVNLNHGFDGEKVIKHSSEAYGVCDECGKGVQVATYRITQGAADAV
jgi:hypothetical protein